jgi:type IV secretion system protein VirD4
MFSKKKQNKNENRKQNKKQKKKQFKKQFNLATIDFKKQLQKNFPYIFVFWISNRLGEYFRLSYQTDIFLKVIDSLNGLANLGTEPFPSLHPFDIFIGICGAFAIKEIVYFKGKNAKKYRKGIEYGSARWGTSEDIKPFIDPKFQNNIILTQTERIMMGRNKIPKYNINKNVLVIGGSGSGKTRFHVKPNLMQMNSSYIVTDPNR